MVNAATFSSVETDRLARLRELVILDSAPEPLFDRLARMASQVCGAPIALISLVDEERQWFKANVGLPGIGETPREVSFCAHAIAESADVFEVCDAAVDERFARNPLVTGAPRIRFYAGVPLVLSAGAKVGTLCVIDREPRRLDERQRATLRELAGMVSDALEMRRGLIARSLSVHATYQEALRQSELRYRAIVEDQSELVSIATADGDLEFVNPAYARHFGRTPGEMLGRNLFDFIHAADREEGRRRLAQVLATGETDTIENRMAAGDGGTAWVAWTHSAYRGADRVSMLLSVGRDVTARKLAEAALRSSQSLLMRTGRVAGVGGWEFDLASGALAWTEETRRIHEVEPDFVPTLENAIAFYAPQARPVIEEAVRRAIRAATPWDEELQVVTARGRPIWVRAVGEAEVEHGKVVRLVGAFQDITRQHALERRVADSERFLRQITDSLPVRIAYLDAGARYRFVNQAHCRRFGLARDAILGRTRGEFLPHGSDPSFDARIQSVLAGEAQRFEIDEVLEGVTRRIEVELIPDVDADGRVRGCIGSGVDITERAATEVALRDLNAIVERTTDYVVQTDWRGAILYMNPAVRALTGMSATQSLAGRNFAEFNTPETNEHFMQVIVPAVKADGVWLGETRVLGAGGRVVPVSHMVIAHRDASGRVSRYSAVMRDISTEAAARQELQRQSATLRSVAAAIPANVAVIDAGGLYRFVNNAFERWIGAHRDHIVGKTQVQVLGRPAFERIRPWVERVLRGRDGRVRGRKRGARQGAASFRDLFAALVAGWPDRRLRQRDAGRHLAPNGKPAPGAALRARRPDRAAEPGRIRELRPGGAGCGAGIVAGLPVHRSRPLQADQRHPWPHGG